MSCKVPPGRLQAERVPVLRSHCGERILQLQAVHGDPVGGYAVPGTSGRQAAAQPRQGVHDALIPQPTASGRDPTGLGECVGVGR